MAGEDTPNAPPKAAFGAPPPSAFASNPAPAAAAPSADLSSRWKQYAAEKSSSSSSSSSKKMVGPDGPDYDLYETPEKGRNPSSASAVPSRQLFSGGRAPPSEPLEPTRSQSFTKKDTNDLIAKYAGVSAIPSSARAEAVKVLAMADERVAPNQAYQVRRTESGGFRASAAPEEPFSFRRSSSKTRRTPAALAGLGLGSKSSSNSTPGWKANRYAFSDPKFRDDDHLEGEDDILGPAVADPLEDENEARKQSSRGYRDHPFDSVGFDGDFPRQKSSWSSRYSDNPSILDQYDRSHSQTQDQVGRKSARKMFMATAGSLSDKVSGFGANVSKHFGFGKATEKTTVFGKGFSFKDNMMDSPSHKRGAEATGVTNLRTVWKDDDNFNDEGDLNDHKQHTTWEQVAAQKMRRRKIGLSVLCFVVSVVIIAVSVSQTAWRWKYKNLWRNGNTHMDVTFYVTSNTPFGYGSTEQQLGQDLQNMPSDAEFVVHLGNVQDSSLGMCPASRMSEMASLLGRSPVPVYIVPGEHDWIRCPNQLTSYGRWIAAFATREAFDTNTMVEGGTNKASSSGEFDRPPSSPDIFSKLHHGVLFFGLHLVSGTVSEGKGAEIQEMRDEKTAIFVRGTLERLKGEYRSVVLMGNARPGPQQRRFFDDIKEDLKDARVPVAYVHAHSGFGETEHYPFGSARSKDVLGSTKAIQAASGAGNQHPLKITVGFGKAPFQVGDDA